MSFQTTAIDIDKDTVSGLTYLENSTEVKYLHSLVLSENGDWSLYISFSVCLVSLYNVAK